MNRIKWDFSHLDEEIQSGRLSLGKTSEKDRIYCFGCTEPQMIPFNETTTVVPIPVIIAVQTEVPLPEKLGLNSVQMQTEQIVDMQKFKMGWIPLVLPKATDKAQAPDSGAIVKRKRTAAPRVWGLACSQAAFSSSLPPLAFALRPRTPHPTPSRIPPALPIPLHSFPDESP